MMFNIRALSVVGFALFLNFGAVQAANAFMENVGKQSIETALDRLKGMQDKLVKDLLDDGNQLIDNMMRKVSDERKATVVQVGSEFKYVVDNLSAKYGSEMRGTIGAASTELRSNLAVIAAWLASMEEVTSKLSALEDDFAID